MPTPRSSIVAVALGTMLILIAMARLAWEGSRFDPHFHAGEARNLTPSPTRIGPATPLVLAPRPPLPTPGPTNELCVHATRSSSVPAVAIPTSGYVFLNAAGDTVRLHVSFENAAGAREELEPHAAAMSVFDALCVVPSGAGPYRRVEIRADHPLDVDAVTWFSGVRRPFPL